MASRTLDVRGRPCPEPVVECRKALADPAAGDLVVLVDNRASAENVSRMAVSMGFPARIEEGGASLFRVMVTQGSVGKDTQPGCAVQPRIVVLVASSLVGQGPEELGRILMRSFIKTIPQLNPLPECIIFMNSGVQLASDGSDLIDDLDKLEKMGVGILSCGTCLDYFHLKDKLRMGRVTNMLEIASHLVTADRVVRI